jgi:N-acetylglucosaminyl-diphospho-decaprenol L-rhamnosyltransferase
MSACFVVIVNYRTAALAVACLSSLETELGALRGGRVVVVDNASGDGSVAQIQAAIETNAWGAWAEVVALPRNGGFAYGNNRGIERARTYDPGLSVVVCLNPDARVRPGALAALIEHLESHERAGIAGASIEDEQGIEQRTAHPFPSPLGELEGAAQLGLLSRLVGRVAPPAEDRARPRLCDWVSGACFAVRRQVLDDVGPLDEGYFLYYEETEFCLRARRAGWSCWIVPQARVIHDEGASTGIRDPRRRRPSYWFDSRRRFFLQAHGAAGLLAADVLWAVGRASLVARRSIGLGGKRKLAPEPERFARDLLLGDAKAMLGPRRADRAGDARDAGRNRDRLE